MLWALQCLFAKHPVRRYTQIEGDKTPHKAFLPTELAKEQACKL